MFSRKKNSTNRGESMPILQLYLDKVSPPCRAVEMVATMAGSKIERHYMDILSNDRFREDFLKLNPLHRVPFLVDGDLKFGESRTIMRYLVDRDLPADNTLYPRDLKQRIKIDEILDLDNGTIQPLIIEIFRHKIFGLNNRPDKRQELKFQEILHYFETCLGEDGRRKFLLSDHITIADITLVATFSIPYICGYNFGLFPRLIDYLRSLTDCIPNYREINREGIVRYRKFMLEMQD